MDQEYDPTQKYIESLKKVTAKEITWGEHHHGMREQMLLALCRGLEVNPNTIVKIRKLEARACAVAGIPN